MGRKFIPNWRRASSRTPAQFSKQSTRNWDDGRPAFDAFRTFGRIQGETSNIEHPTSNVEQGGMHCWRCRFSAVGSWALDVGCSMFCSCPPRRVMGAWWPSRSSKPLSARSTGRGMFDSYPLRHLHSRLAIDDLRFEEATQAASPADSLVNRTSQIANRKFSEGRWWLCHANRSLN